MSVGYAGWFRDADGITQRLRLRDAWTEHTRQLGDPFQWSVVPLVTVDGAALTAAVEQAERSVSATEGELLWTALSLNGGMVDVHASTDQARALQRLHPTQPFADDPLVLLLHPGLGRAWSAVKGPISLAIGADEHGGTILTAAASSTHGPSERYAHPIYREGSARWSFPPRDTYSARITVDRWALLETLRSVADAASLTMALAPDRLIVRTDAGVAGTHPGELVGTPQALTIVPGPLAQAVEWIDATTSALEVCVQTPADEPPRLLLAVPDWRQLIAFPPEGWRFL